MSEVPRASDHDDRAALLDVFLGEAWETLWTLAAGERHLAGRGEAPGLAEDLPIVAHRLGGSAALYGFPALSELTGRMESALQGLRTAPADDRRRMSDLLAGFVDLLKTTLKAIEGGGGEDAALIAAFRARHAGLLDPEGAPAERVVQELDRFFSANPDILTYFGSEVLEHLDVMTAAMRGLQELEPAADALPTLRRAVHTLKGAAYTVGCTPIGDMAHRLEDLLSATGHADGRPAPAMIERAAAAIEALRCMITFDATARACLPELFSRAVGVRPQTPAPSESSGTEPSRTAGPAARSAPLAAREESRVTRVTVRVPVACLDALVDLVGEFVVARSRLERHLDQLGRLDALLGTSASRLSRAIQSFEVVHEYAPLGAPARTPGNGAGESAAGASIAELFAELEFDRYTDINVFARSVREISADLSEIRGQLAAALDGVQDDIFVGQRLVTNLRTEVTRARLVPVARLFSRLPRQVRETARAVGKTVALQVTGTTVEVDSAIIEHLADPLLHLVQNAIVHGLETDAERTATGKPAEGTIHLRARHENGAVFVDVEDDGRGIDLDAVRACAVERGLVTPEAAALLAEPDVLNLLFVPGFSTASQVTHASGRGIGLDVVRSNVLRINGDVEVTTRHGAGTCFTIRIPLTVLITDAVLVGAAGETFAVPLSAIRQIVSVPPERIQRRGEAEMVWVRDQLLDLLRLHRCLALSPPDAHGEVLLLVLRAGGRSFALAVDGVHGKEQCVVKPLGGFPEGLGPFSSGTISSEGRVILVLNPSRLLETTDTAAGAHREVASGGRAAETTPGTDGRKRFLLVDDSISVRKFVGQMLENAGFDVVTASDGAVALQALETTAIHAVVTDLEMPNMNGYELIEHLRRRPSTRDLPIVILTTRGGEKHHDLARRLGVTHFLTKPVQEEAFVELMASLVASTDGRR